MFPARSLTRLSFAVLFAFAPSCAAGGPFYETPEGAAYAFERDFRDSVTRTPQRIQPVVYLNLPPDHRALDSSLQRDLRRYASRIRLFRDSSVYARALVSRDSLSAYGELTDVRLMDSADMAFHRSNFPLDESALRRGSAYQVAHERCRGWPCHDAAGVVVVHTRRGYRGASLLYTIVE